MDRCDRCDEEIRLPYDCSYCGAEFCTTHRRPEDHDCPNPPDADDSEQVFNRTHQTAVDRAEGFALDKNDESAEPQPADKESTVSGVLGRTTPESPECTVCGDLLSSVAFECRFCTTQHCRAHRLPEDHDCEIDVAAEFEHDIDTLDGVVGRSSPQPEREQWWQLHDGRPPYEAIRDP